MENNFCCPKCGNKNLQVTTETNTTTSGSNYSGAKGCLGYLMFGPLGLLCGTCGQGEKTTTTNKTYWTCPNCGNKFEHPDEIRKKIDASNSPIFPIMCVLGAVIGLIFFAIFAEADAGIAFLLGGFTLGVFALVGFLGKVANDSNREKLESKLKELQDNMNRFKDE